MSKRRLVVEGGIRQINKDFDVPDPIPAESRLLAMKVLKANRLWRYKHDKAEDSQASLLEKEFADFLGFKYALAVHSCSAAMFLSLTALGMKHGEDVLTSGFTFTAVPSTILHAGGKPILIDTSDNYCLDIEDLKRKTTTETRFLLLSHMRGHISDMDAISDHCRKHNLILIEDCAHALGARWNGILAGKFGKVACFSFQSYKIINAGEGGMIATDDESLYAKAAFYSGAFERNWKNHIIQTPLFTTYQKRIPAYNMRMSEVTAAIVRPQLPRVLQKCNRYVEHYAAMKKILSGSPYIIIPSPYTKAQPAPDTIQFQMLGFSTKQIDLFTNVLLEEGIEVNYFGSNENVRFYRNWDYLTDKCVLPNTDRLLKSTYEIRLPIFITKKEINTIGSILVDVAEYAATRGLTYYKPSHCESLPKPTESTSLGISA